MQPTFDHAQPTPGKLFLRDANALCKAYFKDQANSHFANWRWWFKVSLIALVLILTYSLLVNQSSAAFVPFLITMVVFHLLCMMFGLNVAHDASHNALFRHKKSNYWFTKAFDLIGISGYVWTLRHVHSHHKYTNVPEMDADLAQQSVIRLSPTVPILTHHRFQVYYAILIYAHYTLLLVYVKDILFLFSKNVGSEKDLRHPLPDVMVSLLGKLIYTGYALVLPIYLLELSPASILLAFYIAHLVTSIIAFLLLFTTHFQNDTTFPDLNDKQRVTMDWATHQLACTGDFAPSSRIITWMTGGLNLHLAHHLYPGICHIHYPAVTQIIRACATKHNLAYIGNSWPGAIASHWRFLYRMGREVNPYGGMV